MCRRNSESEEQARNAGDQAFVGTDVHSPRGRFPYFLKLSITKATCRVNGWEERKSAQNLGSRRVPKKLQGSDHGMGFHALGGNCSHKPAGQGHFCGPSGIRTRGLYLERVASSDSLESLGRAGYRWCPAFLGRQHRLELRQVVTTFVSESCFKRTSPPETSRRSNLYY